MVQLIRKNPRTQPHHPTDRQTTPAMLRSSVPRRALCCSLLALALLPHALAFVRVAPRRSLHNPLSTSSSSATKRPTRASVVAMKVKGILFDMDGTLTDSDSLHFECYRDTLLRFAPEYNNGKPLDRAYYDANMSGSSNDIIVPKLLPHWEHERMKELWLAKETLYRERSVSMKPLDGVLRILDWCDEREIPKIIVTNAPRIDAEHTLKTLGLRDRVVDVVIGEECKRPKPYPDPYLEGLERIGLTAAECIAFEDSFSGLASAQAAGLKTVGILTCRKAEEMLERGAFMAVPHFDAEELWEFLIG